VTGGYAQLGVVSGTGSGAVVPAGGELEAHSIAWRGFRFP
jgi:hypothetical protein